MPIARFMKEVIDTLNYININNFSPVKGNVKKLRRQATVWRKYFQKTYPIKNCYPEYMCACSVAQSCLTLCEPLRL